MRLITAMNLCAYSGQLSAALAGRVVARGLCRPREPIGDELRLRSVPSASVVCLWY